MKFLNRVAIICNICFFLLIPLKYSNYVEKFQWLAVTILVLAVLAIVFNTIVLLVSLIAALIGKKNLIPKTLFFINLICFVIQVLFYFYLKASENG